jgi:hypothetical protein
MALARQCRSGSDQPALLATCGSVFENGTIIAVSPSAVIDAIARDPKGQTICRFFCANTATLFIVFGSGGCP